MHARLRELRSGEVAFVERVQANEASAKRLADMGFIHGARLEMLRPGRPCIIRVEDTYVGLGEPFQRSILIGPSNVE